MDPWELLDIDCDEYHAEARSYLTDHRLWSEANDLAPNGNDAGADVLAFVRENKARLEKSTDAGREIFTSMWQGWGFEVPSDTSNFDDIASDEFRRFTVGFAFAYLKCIGSCPQWLNESALELIQSHEKYVRKKFPNWAHMEEFVSLNSAMEKALLGITS